MRRRKGGYGGENGRLNEGYLGRLRRKVRANGRRVADGAGRLGAVLVSVRMQAVREEAERGDKGKTQTKMTETLFHHGHL